MATGRGWGRVDVKGEGKKRVQADSRKETDVEGGERERIGEQGKVSFLQTREEIYLQLDESENTRVEMGDEEEVQRWRRKRDRRRQREGHWGKEAP